MNTIETGQCVVLGDAAVHKILIDLSKDEIQAFAQRIAVSLQDFSVRDERAYQPEPAVVKRPDGRKSLFRPFTSSTGVGIKIIVDPAAALAKQEESLTDAERTERSRLAGLHGILALCDENGFPQAFINAEEITGYRTSLSAILLYVYRLNTANLVVFGAGKQALWHIRLALALRGSDIKSITIVNRSTGRTKDLLAQIQIENDQKWKSDVQLGYTLPNDVERLQIVLSETDVIFCTTPSKEILFPAATLLNRKRGCYISAIGSWSADMIELDPELVRSAARNDEDNSLFVVDDRDGCILNTGEVVQSGLQPDEITEIGELLDLMGKTGSDLQQRTKRCLEEGFVVYKSMGVSMTDLSAGQALLSLARKRKQGLAIPDF